MQYKMSTKASPPATGVKIKKEIPSDEIKDFAETAMNELLGWYGYDSVDRIDLSSKVPRLIANANQFENSNRNAINGSRISHREDSTTPDRESSREDSKSPSSTKISDKLDTYCGWCRRIVPENSPEFLTTPDGPRYCSESCFAQSRRASFKRAKTCDWCRHVRHAVSYVDFQDGASQLQFCSDKCLNQYKMQIFCKETQAHLDMNPHLKEKGIETSGGLITPDLWLKNCRSRSASPVSELSRSPTPTTSASATLQQPVHKPIISVAPVAKLMSKSPSTPNTVRQSPKHGRKKRNPRPLSSQSTNSSNVLNTNSHNNNNNNNNNHNSNNKTKILASSLASSPALPKPCTFTNVQDLRLNVSQIPNVENTHPPRHNLPPGFFSPSHPANFPIRPPFLPPHHHPRLMGVPPPQQMPPVLPPDLTGLSALLGSTPPVTVMVPYPIIVPLPIPIPIPLPITDFIKAAAARAAKPKSPMQETKSDSPQRIKEDQDMDDDTFADQPLDFTKSKVSPEKEATKPVEEAPTTNTATLEEPSVITEAVVDEDESEDKQKFPKFKITRLRDTKRLITKESENSRPLRKRKRIIDCDYLRSPKDESDTSKHKK